MTHRSLVPCAALALLTICATVQAKRAMNAPYVMSGPVGAMYAKDIHAGTALTYTPPAG